MEIYVGESWLRCIRVQLAPAVSVHHHDPIVKVVADVGKVDVVEMCIVLIAEYDNNISVTTLHRRVAPEFALEREIRIG